MYSHARSISANLKNSTHSRPGVRLPFFRKRLVILLENAPDRIATISKCIYLPVRFFFSQHGQPSPDLHTPSKSSRLANIRLAFGPALARELVELECSKAEQLLDRATGGTGEERRVRVEHPTSVCPRSLLRGWGCAASLTGR